jgi:PAS domain-containing protein
MHHAAVDDQLLAVDVGRLVGKKKSVASELHLQEITEKTGEVLCVPDGTLSELLFCNSKCEKIYGVPVVELKGNQTRFLDCVHPEDVPAVKETMRTLWTGDPVDMEYLVNPSTECAN